MFKIQCQDKQLGTVEMIVPATLLASYYSLRFKGKPVEVTRLDDPSNIVCSFILGTARGTSYMKEAVADAIELLSKNTHIDTEPVYEINCEILQKDTWYNVEYKWNETLPKVLKYIGTDERGHEGLFISESGDKIHKSVLKAIVSVVKEDSIPLNKGEYYYTTFFNGSEYIEVVMEYLGEERFKSHNGTIVDKNHLKNIRQVPVEESEPCNNETFEYYIKGKPYKVAYINPKDYQPSVLEYIGDGIFVNGKGTKIPLKDLKSVEEVPE